MKRKEIKYYLPSVILAIIITYGSLMPSDGDSPLKLIDIEIPDKLTHGTFYFLLTLSILLPVILKKIKIKLKEAIIILSIFSYGLLMEVLQYFFIESRSGEFLDILANSAGIFLGYIAYLFSKNLHYNKN
ncbi:MAG: VanZ family protein [Bacteroidales bacterium]